MAWFLPSSKSKNTQDISDKRSRRTDSDQERDRADSNLDDDQRLLLELKKGSAKAVETWYRRYYPYLSKVISQKVASNHDVEELVQDTFQSCLRHLPVFRGESSISTWMYRIARHEIADFYRKKYAKRAIKTLPLIELLVPDKLSSASEASEVVRQALQRLPHHLHELLLLKYVDGKKVKSIALETGRSAKAIESDLFRAREMFKIAYSEIAS